MVTTQLPERLPEFGGRRNGAETLDKLCQLTPDRWNRLIVRIFQRKLDSAEPLWELCCALNRFARRVIHRGNLQLISGDSRETAPGELLVFDDVPNPDCPVTGFWKQFQNTFTVTLCFSRIWMIINV